MFRGMFRSSFPQHRLYFCNYALRKTVKSQLNGISQRNQFKDKTLRVIRRLINLPTVSNAKVVQEELAACKIMLDQVPAEHENVKGLHDVR